jgi:hypothetical protein
LALTVTGALGSLGVSASAQEFGYRNAPPAPHHEVVPAPRHGYAWVPGHWERRDHRYSWVSGTWVHERRGEHFVPARWTKRDGRYFFTQGHWMRTLSSGHDIAYSRTRNARREKLHERLNAT